MQPQNRSSSHFSQRTEDLAFALKVLLKDLPVKIGISERMFYAYRTGANPVSDKAWRKLEQAEIEAESQGYNIRSFRSSDPEPQSSMVRDDETPYRFTPIARQLTDLAPVGGLEPLLERIAKSLEKLVELEERKNLKP